MNDQKDLILLATDFLGTTCDFDICSANSIIQRKNIIEEKFNVKFIWILVSGSATLFLPTYRDFLDIVSDGKDSNFLESTPSCVFSKDTFMEDTIHNYESKYNICAVLYAGNDTNDIPAFEYLKTLSCNSLPNLGIAPKNANSRVKLLADYVSNENNIYGVIDGLDYFIEFASKN